MTARCWLLMVNTVSLLDLPVPIFKQVWSYPMVRWPSWKRIQLQSLACKAIMLRMDHPPPRFSEDKPYAEQQHGWSVFTPFLSGSQAAATLMFPAAFFFFFLTCFCHKTLAVLSYIPFLLAGQKADRWPVFARTDESASENRFYFLKRSSYFCLPSFLSCQFSRSSPSNVVVFVRRSYTHYTQTWKEPELSVLLTPSHITHSLGLSYPHNSLEAISLQTPGLQTSTGTHKDQKLQVQSASVLRRGGIQHLQILPEHEQARHDETLHRVFPQNHVFFLFFQSDYFPKTWKKWLESRQRGSEVNS